MVITKPIFRIFDYNRAIDFYIHWLGFQIDWEAREENTPVYMQISLDAIVIHLSEHHGDCCPGARVFIEDFKGLEAYHKRLLEKKYKYNRPGIEVPFYDSHALEMTVIDPFANRLSFVERNVKKSE
ncbi:MAG: glyoxalase superfamily protein [Bacteroidota bacterium]|nr:glyoxalase superfamily protein [Bacteroidota bacterium]